MYEPRQRHRPSRPWRWLLAVLLVSASLAQASGGTCELRPVLDQEYLPTLLGLVEGARHRVGVMHFLLFVERGRTKSLVDALREARQRGVEVRILLEGHKSGVSERNRRTAALLEAEGMAVGYSGANRMLHSKLVIVDDDAVLVGSSNLTPTSLQENHEANVLVRSSAAAAALWRHFDAVWERPWKDDTTVRVIEDGGTRVLTDRAFLDEALAVIAGAERRVRVMSYLFAVRPDEPWSSVQRLVQALTEARRRGVDVDVLLERSDFSDFVNDSGRRAVEYLRQRNIERVRFDRPDRITHGKLIIADDERVVVGSTNWYQRGLAGTHQVNVSTNQRAAVDGFTRYFDGLFDAAATGRGD